MLMFQVLSIAACAGLVAAQSGCSFTTPASSSPTKPASDPFWQAPSDLSTRPQGSVFNCRAVNWKSVDGASAYFQYAYKTIRSNGSSMVAVATLLIPNNTAPNQKFSQLLSYQVAYDSPTSYCGPSFVNQLNAPSSTGNSYGVSSGQTDQSPTQALNAGIPVVISDYEGITAGFTVGLTSGYGTLNGVRAVIQQSGFFTAKPSIALWGYSGGALATEFALELAATQASDLKIIGAALGGLTPVTRNTVILVNGPHSNIEQSGGAALIPYAVLGISNENNTVNNWVQTNLKTTSEPFAPNQAPYKTRFNNAASDNCNSETGGDFFNSNFTNWFNNIPPSSNIYDVPTISDAFNLYGVMGQTGNNSRTTPRMPLYFYKGTADEISVVADTDALYNQYCNAKASITYVRYNGLSHLQAGTKGQGPAWSYLQARFNGVATSGCSETTQNPPSKRGIEGF